MSALQDDFQADPWHEGDLDEEADRYERGQRLYACTDRMCGALDCATCYPASFDASEPEEEEP